MLSVIVIVMLGVLSLIHIPIEIKPGQTEQGIQIVAYWKKHPPETVQRQVTQPLENIAIQLKDISAVESSSGIGIAVIQLKFPENTELKYAYVELRERLATIRNDLPPDIDLRVEPLFADEEAEQDFKQAFFDLELIGPFPLNELRRIAGEKVVPQLNGIDGVSRIELYGGSDGFVRIDINEDILRALEIDPETVQRQIESHSINRGLGHVLEKKQSKMLIMDIRPRVINDLERIPIREGLQLGDISRISFTYEDPTTLSRHNFDPLVLLRIFKIPGSNALVFAKTVRNRLAAIRDKLPEKVHIRVASDSSDELRAELKSLAIRVVVILSVVFAILFALFRRWMLSVIVLMVVLLSIVGASIFLYWSGYTINVITLAGIALVFGMLVDNSVVVMENIQRCRMRGKSVLGSGLRGTMEMFQSLSASTGTTVLVFLALLLLQNRLGAYYKPLAFVLSFSLIMSLIIALTLIPAVVVRWPNLMNNNTNLSRRFKGLSWYSSFLRFVIKRRKSTLILVSLLLAVSTWLFWNNIERGGFIYWGKKQKLDVYVNAPKGVTLEVLNNIIRNFEEVVRRQGVDCSARTVVDEKNSYGYLEVTFPDSVLNSIAPFVMKEYLIAEAVNYAGVGIGISGFGIPYWNGGYKVRTILNTVLQITGPDYYRLWEIGESILALAKMDSRVNTGVVSPSIRSLYQSDLKEYRFTADVERLWNNRISISSAVAGARRVFLEQNRQGEITIAEKRYPLMLRYSDGEPELETLSQQRIKVKKNQLIPVADYFSVEKKAIQPWIDKKNQQYRFTVAWQYRGPERMRSRHEKSIVNALELPPGYKLEERQWGFLTKKEEGDLLRLLLLVTAGMFMILAALYESFSQPIIIFLSVPFALIGVFLSYFVFGRDFDVNGYIGLILLMGIVLNNGIVLVDRINQLRKKGFAVIEAAIQGGVERIRPIMITTLTTVGGLIPLFFIGSGNTAMAKILEELSFITVGGLISSTVFTVTLIPLFYVIIEEIHPTE